jgi:hypothetical protein
MAGATKTFTVTDAAWVSIRAQINTSTITVRENTENPTTAWLVALPDQNTGTGITLGTGQAYSFSKSPAEYLGPCGMIPSGELAGAIKLSPGGGSVTFQQEDN